MPGPVLVMLILISAVILFHLLIFFHIIPYEITWGGRLKNDTEMYVFEIFSIALNFFLGWVILMKSNYVSFKFRTRIINGLLWFFLILFLVNTIGNFFAATNFEKSFSIITLLFSCLIWKIIGLKTNMVAS